MTARKGGQTEESSWALVKLVFKINQLMMDKTISKMVQTIFETANLVTSFKAVKTDTIRFIKSTTRKMMGNTSTNNPRGRYSLIQLTLKTTCRMISIIKTKKTHKSSLKTSSRISSLFQIKSKWLKTTKKLKRTRERWIIESEKLYLRASLPSTSVVVWRWRTRWTFRGRRWLSCRSSTGSGSCGSRPGWCPILSG